MVEGSKSNNNTTTIIIVVAVVVLVLICGIFVIIMIKKKSKLKKKIPVFLQIDALLFERSILINIPFHCKSFEAHAQLIKIPSDKRLYFQCAFRKKDFML